MTRTEELDALIPAVYPWAMSVATLLCRDRERAQDLVQDALVQALRRPPEPLSVDTLRPWLRTVMTRLHIRSSTRARNEARALLRIGRRASAPDEILEPDDALLRALAVLAPRQRACVVLRYVEDLSEEQVAQTLGIRLGTVKAHLAQARERLRPMLDARSPDPVAPESS